MAHEISDQGIFEITKVLYSELKSQNNLKRLNVDQLDQFKRMQIKPLYPHKQIIRNGKKEIQKYQCSQYCCDLYPGSFCCFQTERASSQYLQFGLGICMYVKFIRHITVFLFFVSFLAMLSIVIYQIASNEIGINITQSYNNMIYSTTAGVLSSQYSKCKFGYINDSNTNVNLSCNVGQITLLEATFTNSSIESILNCDLQFAKLQKGEETIIASLFSESINKISSSNYSINMSGISNIPNNQNHISFNYICTDGNFIVTDTQIPTQYAVYGIVGIDLFIIALFTFFLCSESSAETKEIKNYQEKQLAVHDFTVKIKGFRLNNYQRELQTFIQGYNEMRNHNPLDSYQSQKHFIHNIVQIKLPQISQKRQAEEKRRHYYEKMQGLITQTFFDDDIDMNKYQDTQNFIKKCFGSNTSYQYIKYKKELSRMVSKFLISKKVQYSYEVDDEISIFMTLTNPKHKRQMIRRAKTGCFGNYLKIYKRKYYISEPPIADMILWQNKNKVTLIRVLISWLFTIAICFGSYLLVGYTSYKQQEKLQDYSNNFQNCQGNYSSENLISLNETLINDDGYLSCYCSKNYFQWNSQSAQLRSVCSSWFQSQILYYAIPILISIIIVFYNLVISRIFRLLTKFEGHKQLSTQLYSYIIKRCFILIMNMVLIMILLKFNFNGDFSKFHNFSFLFMGIYNDVTSGWYFDIGVVIILTLGINILIPLFDMLFVWFLKCLRQCWDRRCYCTKTSQKTKKGYMELYSEDIFPIEQRYAVFMSLIIIVMAFSAVMPFLYIIAFLSIWFMFICDKLLLFRVYQKPINFSKDLQDGVFRVLYVSLMAHCVISAFILSEPHLLQAGGVIPTSSRFSTILTTNYLMPYVIIFLLLAIWGIFCTTIVKFCSFCSKKLQNQLGKVYETKFHQNFFNALNYYQICKLKLSLELQLCNNVTDIKVETLSQASIVKRICQNTLKMLKLKKSKKRLTIETSQSQDNIKLIGKVGYEEMLEDEIFLREKKIKSLHEQFIKILQKEFIQSDNPRENSLNQINLAARD